VLQRCNGPRSGALLCFDRGGGTSRSADDLVACNFVFRRRLMPAAGQAGMFDSREWGRVVVAIQLACSEVALEALAEAGEESQTL
jgi:hypothetical protein